MTPAAALAAAVAVEDQAVYGYGLVGAHLSGAPRRIAATTLDGHLARRDHLTALLHAAGGTPSPAPPAYLAPHPVTSAATAAALAASLEDACAGAAWDLVAATGPGQPARTLAVAWLAEAASAAAGWRTTAGAVVAATPALPGRP